MMTLRGVFHDEGGVFGASPSSRGASRLARRPRASAAPKPPRITRDEGAVHRLAHDVAEDRAGRADQRAGDDQRRVLEREAERRGRPAGIGVQHRDDDRHVGAADRDDEHHADQQRRGPRPPRSAIPTVPCA